MINYMAIYIKDKTNGVHYNYFSSNSSALNVTYLLARN